MQSADVVTLLILALPVLLACFVVIAKNEAVANSVGRLSAWLAAKDASLSQSSSFRRRYLVRAIVWPLKKIGDLTASMANRYWLSAVRIVAFGYFALVVLFILAAVAYSLFLLAVTVAVVAILFSVLFGDAEFKQEDRRWARPARSDSADDEEDSLRMAASARASADLVDTSGLLDHRTGRVDESGRVFDTTGLLDMQTHRIDRDGRIFDTTGLLEKQIGRVDQDGRIFDTTGLLDHQIGRVDDDGRVFDTTKLLDQQIGRVEKREG